MPTPYLPQNHGVYLASVGAAWTDLDASNFTSVSPRAPAAGNYFGELVIVNTHAAQALFVLLRANTAESTDNAIYIGGRSSRVLSLYGKSVNAISIQGSGADTTARLDAEFTELP